MMVMMPLFVAVLLGGAILLITMWLRKTNSPLFIKLLPGILAALSALTIFYIGIVKVRGFEGAAYGFLALFLILFAIISLILARNPNNN